VTARGLGAWPPTPSNPHRSASPPKPIPTRARTSALGGYVTGHGVYRETLAGFLATRAARHLHALADRTVFIRSDCTGAISTLRKGSFRSPALQNEALLHNRLFMDVSASPPHYLHSPGTVMHSEGVDDLSRAVARSIHASASKPALREKVAAEAERWLGAPLSLDLFATADNALPGWFPCSSRGSRSRSRRESTRWHNRTGAALAARTVELCIGSASSRFRSWRCCRHSSGRRGRTGCAASSSSRSRLPTRRGRSSHPRRSRSLQGPLPDPPELGSVRLRRGRPGWRSAPGHP
jgi:hypothetical protein